MSMSKKWFVISILTLLLLAGTWYLYTYQSDEEISEVQINPDVLQPSPGFSETSQIIYQEITLFVIDPQTGSLRRRLREIPEHQELLDKITQTIEYLIHPDSDIQNEAIPEETALLSVFVTHSGIVYLNLSRHVQDRHIGGLSAELATVASLVNTLLFNFQEIKQVQILVEGAEIETLAGHVDCRKPFSKMFLIDS